jgi:hypothetical protein
VGSNDVPGGLNDEPSGLKLTFLAAVSFIAKMKLDSIGGFITMNIKNMTGKISSRNPLSIAPVFHAMFVCISVS